MALCTYSSFWVAESRSVGMRCCKGICFSTYYMGCGQCGARCLVTLLLLFGRYDALEGTLGPEYDALFFLMKGEGKEGRRARI
jgi:hypothetical protein